MALQWSGSGSFVVELLDDDLDLVGQLILGLYGLQLGQQVVVTVLDVGDLGSELLPVKKLFCWLRFLRFRFLNRQTRFFSGVSSRVRLLSGAGCGMAVLSLFLQDKILVEVHWLNHWNRLETWLFLALYQPFCNFLVFPC